MQTKLVLECLIANTLGPDTLLDSTGVVSPKVNFLGDSASGKRQ